MHSKQLDGNVRYLNINQVVTSLACGRLDEQLERDLLVIGTSTNIIAHDVDRNVDLFFKEVRDCCAFVIRIHSRFSLASRRCLCVDYWQMGRNP